MARPSRRSLVVAIPNAVALALGELVADAKKHKRRDRHDGRSGGRKTSKKHVGRDRNRRAGERRQRNTEGVPSPLIAGPPPEVGPPPNPDPYCIDTIAPIYYETNVNSLIRTRTAEQVAAKRAELIEFIWKGAGFPTRADVIVTENIDSPIASLPDGTVVDSFATSVGDATSHARHFRAGAPSGRLMLYLAGHTDDLARNGGDRTIQFLLGRGDDVLALWMPCLGPNACPTGVDHNELASQEDAAFTPLVYFLEPPIVALNHLLGQRPYDVGMIGLSGGGWTTTWIAAIDPRIRLSVPIAGSLPLFLRTPPCGETGDWEQNGSAVYALVDYTELYVLGAAGAGRKQVQVINKYDPCCFYGVRYLAYADIVHDVVAALDGGAWHGVLDTTHREHTISDWALTHVVD